MTAGLRLTSSWDHPHVSKRVGVPFYRTVGDENRGLPYKAKVESLGGENFGTRHRESCVFLILFFSECERPGRPPRYAKEVKSPDIGERRRPAISPTCK